MIAKRLKLHLNHQIVSLLINSVLWGGVLGIVHTTQNVWWWVVYCGICFYIYIKFLRGTIGGFWMFASCSAASIGIAVSVPAGAMAVLSIAAMTVIMAMCLGSLSLTIQQHETALSIAYYFIVFEVVSLVLYHAMPPRWIGGILLLIIFFYFTTKEYIANIRHESTIRTKSIAIIIALLTSQVTWVVSLLSLGVLNEASLVLVFFITILDAVMHYLSGTLTRKTLYHIGILCGACTIAIVTIPYLI